MAQSKVPTKIPALRNVPYEPYTPHCSESRLAAYLGLNDTSDLRHFAFSWPFLKWMPHIHPLWKSLQRFKIIQILDRNMAELKAVHNASAEYAAVSTDTDTQKAMKKRLRIAHQVMKLRDDLIEYETLSDQENRHRTELYIKEFLNTLSLENLAFVGTTHLRLLKPYLGPFPGENVLKRSSQTH
ncbi:SNF2-like protein [Penicillium chermesinum]|uniref:SNF2-like protein n=1 Tax=Penicillium chermesinum TaxID=63820 RepID=A0A9W9TD13_9EURO|nr:SNF2-like protein [Penicillium chermesinum]KAJ5217100.1 SNF2-like protein [Penicillium chermesinum]